MLPTRHYEQVATLAAQVAKLPEAGDQLCHHFDFGVYVRGALYPADTVVVGAIHLEANTFVLAKGTLRIADGANPPVEVVAPYSCTTQPGTQRVLYAVTDCVAYAIFETPVTTVEDAEGTLAVNTVEEFNRLTNGDAV